MGVSTSRKPCSSKYARVAIATFERNFKFRSISGRRKSRYRYRNRNSSFTRAACSGSSTGNGNTSARFNTSSDRTNTSTSPVAIFGLAVPSGRRRTTPVTRTTLSGRNDDACSNNSAGTSDGSNTVWVRPSRSRMSRKITPPRSRRECTHPTNVTVCPTCSGRSSLQ